MAFGDLKGTLVGGGTSIASATGTAAGSVVVAPQDLVVVMVAEAAANTISAVTSNLGGAFTAVNAGTLSSAGGRLFYRVITASGTLTSVSCTMTTSSNDYAVAAAVFEGPFTSTPLDRAPANTTDATTPFTCAATTVLSQANELIVASLALIRGQTATTATSPLVLAVNSASAAANTANSVSATLGRQVVAATTSVTPVFALVGGTLTGGVQCVATFRQGVVDTTTGTASGTSTVTGGGRADFTGIGQNAAGISVADGRGSSDREGIGSAIGAGAVSGTGLATTPTYPLGLISQTNKIFPLNGGTTDPIDTSGATLLFANISVDVTSSFLNVTDNKGNSWFINSSFNDAPSGAVVANRTFSITINNPNVGPGHTLTVGGTNNKVVIQFSAWRSSTSWTPSQIQYIGGALPHGAGSVTAFNPGELAITTYAGANTPTGVDAPFAILNTVAPSANNHATSIAYNVRSSTGALNPVWYGSGNAAVTTQLFWGTWLDANASVGTASAIGSANAVLASDAGIGSASAVGTALGVSPSAGATLITHAEGYGGPTGGVTNSVDTTGSNLLILHINYYDHETDLTFSDSKGNAWALIGTVVSTASNGPMRDSVYYAPTRTPIVGAGHAVTHSSKYSSAELLAFSVPGYWMFDEIAGAEGTTPVGPSLTTDAAAELVISTATSDGPFSFVSVTGGLTIITSAAGVDFYNYAVASAYKVQPSPATVQAIWTASSVNNGASQIFAFKPNAVLSNAYLVNSYTPGGTPRDDYTGQVGLLFQADTTEPLVFNRIGARCGTGNTGLHRVNLYEWPGENNVVGTALRTAQIDFTGATVGNFYYAEIPEIGLFYPNRYLLVAEVISGNGQFWSNDNSSPVTLTGAVSGQVFSAYITDVAIAHAENTPNIMFHGVDLAYVTGSVDTGTGVGNATATALAYGDGSRGLSTTGTAASVSTVNAAGRSDVARQGIATAAVLASGTTSTGQNRAGVAAALGLASGGIRSDAVGQGAAAAVGLASGTTSTGLNRAGTAAALGLASGGIRSDVAGQGSATASGQISGASSAQIDRSGQGVATVTGLASGTASTGLNRAGTAAALSLATADGRSDATGQGSTLATGQASGTSSSQIDRNGQGVAAASGIALATGQGDGTAAGLAAVTTTAVGASASGLDRYGDGAAVAAALAGAAGRGDAITFGTGVSVGTATATGRGDGAAVGSAAAVGSVNGLADVGFSQGNASGVAVANATGRADGPGRGVAAGLGAATATGLGDGTGTAASIAASIATGFGRADAIPIGGSTATATANASSRTDIRSTGDAVAAGVSFAAGSLDVRRAGNAAGVGFGRAVILVVGRATGAGNALAASRSDAVITGTGIASGVAGATAVFDISSVALSLAYGHAVSFSVEPGAITKVVNLIGHLPAPLPLVGSRERTVQLTGTLPRRINLTGNIGE